MRKTKQILQEKHQRQRKRTLNSLPEIKGFDFEGIKIATVKQFWKYVLPVADIVEQSTSFKDKHSIYYIKFIEKNKTKEVKHGSQ